MTEYKIKNMKTFLRSAKNKRLVTLTCTSSWKTKLNCFQIICFSENIYRSLQKSSSRAGTASCAILYGLE